MAALITAPGGLTAALQAIHGAGRWGNNNAEALFPSRFDTGGGVIPVAQGTSKF